MHLLILHPSSYQIPCRYSKFRRSTTTLSMMRKLLSSARLNSVWRAQFQTVTPFSLAGLVQECKILKFNKGTQSLCVRKWALSCKNIYVALEFWALLRTRACRWSTRPQMLSDSVLWGNTIQTSRVARIALRGEGGPFTHHVNLHHAAQAERAEVRASWPLPRGHKSLFLAKF